MIFLLHSRSCKKDRREFDHAEEVYCRKENTLAPSSRWGMRVRLWTDEDIENVRKILPKIANGRKTRYQKLRDKQKAQAKKTCAAKNENEKINHTPSRRHLRVMAQNPNGRAQCY